MGRDRWPLRAGGRALPDAANWPACAPGWTPATNARLVTSTTSRLNFIWNPSASIPPNPPGWVSRFQRFPARGASPARLDLNELSVAAVDEATRWAAGPFGVEGHAAHEAVRIGLPPVQGAVAVNILFGARQGAGVVELCARDFPVGPRGGLHFLERLAGVVVLPALDHAVFVLVDLDAHDPATRPCGSTCPACRWRSSRR